MDTRSPIVVRKRPPVRMGFRPYVPDPEPVYSPESGTFDTFGLPPGAPAAPASALLPPAPRIPIGQDFGDEDLGLGSIGRDTAPNRFISDSANSLAKGSIGLGEFGAGVADTALTLNPANLGATAVRAAARAAGYDVPEPEQFRVGPALESVGWRPKETRQFLAEQDSPELQAARAEVAKAKGFFPSLEASVRNPSTVVQGSIESLPSMAAGGGVSRTLLGLAPEIAPAVAAGFGEGLVQTGQAAEGTRQETGTLTPVQAAAAGVSGAIDAVISRFAGRVADRLKIPGADPDVLMTGAKAAGVDEGLVKRVVGGLVREGLLEELPQSAQEQFFQNVATDRPWMEGVAEAGVQGGLSGALMGGAANVFGQGHEGPPAPRDAPPTTNWAPQAPGEVESRLAQAPIAPRAPKTDMAAQLVLEAEMAGKSGLDALLSAGMSKDRAKRELQRVRDLVGPKVAPAKAVDTAEDRKAAALRPDADKILADLRARERAGRPSPQDEISSFEDDPLANAAKRTRQGTPEELAAYLEASQKGIGTAEDEATIGAISDRARSEAQANLENQAYAPLLRKQEPSPTETAVRAEAQRNLEEQWAREHADQFAVAEAGGPAFYVPKLIAKAVEANSIKPLVDAGVPGSPSQLRKMLEKAKASAVDEAKPSTRAGDERTGPVDLQSPFPGIGVPGVPGQLGEVGQEARAVAEGVNSTTGTEEAPVAVEAGPSINRTGGIRPDEVRSEPNGRPRDQAGEGSEVHGESVPPNVARDTSQAEPEPKAPNLTVRGRDYKAHRVESDDGRPTWRIKGQKGAVYFAKKTGDRIFVTNDRRGSRGGELGGEENPFTGVDLKDQGGNLSVAVETKRAPISPAPRPGTPEEDVTTKLVHSVDMEKNFNEVMDRLESEQAARDAEQEALPQRLEESVRNTRREGVQREPAVATANEGALSEVSGTNRVAEVRPGPVGEKLSGEGGNVGEDGGIASNLVADEAPKAVEAHAESVPPKAPETKHEFSSTQVDMPPAVAEDVKSIAAGIADEDLAGDGRETEPHATVKFGLHTNETSDVRKVLAGEAPIKVKFGEISTFPPSAGSDGAEVVKIDLDSPDLHRLNKKIAGALDVTDTHPDYKPHVTLAYVKPGEAKKYVGRPHALQGKEITLNSVTFSAKDGREIVIPLTGKPQEAATVPVERPQPEPRPARTDQMGTPRPKPEPVKNSNFEAFTASMTPMQKGKTRAALAQDVLNNGKPISRAALVERKVSEGATVTRHEVKDESARKKLQAEYERLRRTAPIGNERHPDTIRLNELRVKLAPTNGDLTKDQRRLSNPDRSFLSDDQIGKTAMDYAEFLIAKRDGAKPAVPQAEVTKLRGLQLRREKAFEQATENLRTIVKNREGSFYIGPQSRISVDGKDVLVPTGPILRELGAVPDEKLNHWRMPEKQTAVEAEPAEVERVETEPQSPAVAAEKVDKTEALKARVDAAKENLERAKSAQYSAKGKRDKEKLQKRIDVLDKEHDDARRAAWEYRDERLKIEGDPAQKLIAGKRYDQVDEKALTPIVRAAVEANPRAKEFTPQQLEAAVKSFASNEWTPFYGAVIDKGLEKAVDNSLDVKLREIVQKKALEEIAGMTGLEERTGYGQKDRFKYREEVKRSYRAGEIEKILVEARSDNEKGLAKKAEDARIEEQQAKLERERTASLKDPVPASMVSLINKLTKGEYEALSKGVSPDSPFRMAAEYPSEATLKRLGERGLVEKQLDPLTKTEEWVGTLTPFGQEVAKATERYDSRLKIGVPFSEREAGKGRFSDAFDAGDTLVVGKVNGKDVHSSGRWIVEGPKPKQAEKYDATEFPSASLEKVMAPRKQAEQIRPVAYFESDRGEYIVMSNGSVFNARYFDYVSNIRPGASLEAVAGEKETPVYFKKDGKYVGAVMPVRYDLPAGAQAILDGDQVEEPLTRVEKPAEPAPAEKPKEPTRAISDVGEHIGGSQTKETDKGVAMFDRKPSAPSFSRPTTPFFSQLERAAEQMKQPMRGAEALRFLSTREGVKAAELKWTGLDDFLQKRGGERVTPEDVKEFLKANKVTVTEVTKGYDRVDKAFDGWTDEDVVTHYGDVFGSAPEDGMTIEQMKREISNAEEEGMEGGTGAPSTPKFSQYQTPGGTNYREVLLTLPPKAEGAAGLTVDAIAKRLGYSGWHSSLTEDQKARVNAAFAAQPYGPGKGPEVEPGRGAFRSSHFDEPNILAHVRLNDRTVNGKKVLFVEEIQSDYGQMARRNGIFGRRWGLLDNSRVFEYVEGTRQEAEALAKKRSEEREALGLPSEVTVVQPKNGAVPDAPFIEKTEEWTALALKAILHKASTEGYDSVAFTTGDMQNARYDLAKQVDKIQAFHRKDGTFDLMVLKKGDRSYTDINKLTPSQLEDNIGKDLAAKIVEQPQEGATGAGWKTYEGLDLAVGGKGMRAFYDKIVPQVAEKIGKKWGAKVGTMNFRAGGEDPHSWKIVTRDARFRVLDSGGQLFPNEFDVKEQAEKFIRDAKAESALSGAPVHSIAITPEMRASVTSEGFPLFQRTDQTTEEAWQHYDSKDGEKTTLSPTAYRDGGRIVGAPPDVRVVDFMGDVDKSVLTDMAKSRASLAHYVASAERQIQRAVPGFKFGGFTPAGNLHGVNFQGRVFLNDLATHQIALEIVSAERITYPEAYARAMWDVILHESAHYAEKGHKGPFLAELDRIETEVGPQAIRAIKRDFMRYASEEKHRTQTQKMYEKALPGWREGERRGREAAARAETRSGGLRTRPDVATGFQPRPRGDTGDSEGVRGEGDEPQGSLFAPDGNQAEGLAAPAFVRGTDGRGVEPPAPAFARKPAAPAPTPEELKDPTFWEKVMETRRAFILASWRFLGGNVAGNTISQLSGLAEIPLTAFWDRKMNPGQRRVFAEELNRAVSAIISIGPQASKKLKTDLWDTIKQKENLGSNENEEGKYEQQHRAIGGGKNSSAAEKKLGTAIRTILRMAEITDRFYKTLSWEQSVSRQAYRIARGEGLMGAAASSRADKMMEDFRTTFGSREATLKELRSDKGTPAQRRMLENSHRESRYRTYTLPANAENAGWFGEIAQWIKAAEKWKVVGPIVQSQFLFKNTPANVAFQGFERSPIAWFSVYDKLRALNDLKKKIEAAPDADTRAALESGLDKKAEAATDAMARATMGSAIAAIGFGLAAAGLLTGSGPPDPDDREQWMNAGNIPNAIKIGDHWFAFDKLDSMTTALALAANMTQAKNEKDASKMGGAFLNALQSAFIDNSYLNSFGRLSDMISLATKDPERAISKWLQDVEGSFVPAFVRQTAEFVDPVVRSKRGWIAPIKSGIPGLSKSLPAVRTGTGEPAKRTQRLGESTLGPLSPFGFMRTGDAKGDPLAKEFLAAGYSPDPHRDFLSIGVGPVGAKVQHRVDLTEKELEVFRTADEQTTKRLREIIKSDEWARLSAEQKKGYFQKVYAAMGAKAKEAVMPGVVARLRSTLGARK